MTDKTELLNKNNTLAFQLHPKLIEDTFFIRDLKLSRLLLMNDQRFPWLILVPRRSNLKELYELAQVDQQLLLSEITQISELLKIKFNADKINVAALGNVVPQLHVHIVVRTQIDAAWPSPVWGFGNRVSYSTQEIKKTTEYLSSLISTLTEIL